MIYEPMDFWHSSMTGPFGSLPAFRTAYPCARSSQLGDTSTINSQFGFQPPFRQTDNTYTSSFPQFSLFPPFGSTGCSQFGGTLTRNSQFFFQPPFRQTDNTRTNSFPQVSAFPPFGTPYTPAPFGTSDTPAFGWGPAPSQTNPFGSTFQQAQPAYGTNTLGLTAPFGAPCQPAFGLQLPLLVVPQAPMFFVSQEPQYLQQQFPQQMVPQSAQPLGLQQIRCSLVLDFGYQVPQNLEAQVSPVSSSQNTSPFGAPIASVAQSPYSNQSSVGGNLTETTKAPAGRSGFSQPVFGPRQGGTRVETYVSTPTEVSGNLQSISAMFTYEDKSHEELRWEDYQCGDKDCTGGRKLPASVPINQSHSASHTLPENTTFGTPRLDPFSSFSCTAFNNGSSTYYPRFQHAFSSLPFGESSTPASSASPSTFGTLTVGSSSTFGHAIPSGSCLSIGPSFGCSTVTSTSPFGHSLSYGTTTPALVSSPSGFVSGNPSFGCSTVTSTTPFGHSLSYGSTTPALFSSPSGFVSGRPSLNLPFGHSLSHGTTTAAPISSPLGFVSGRGSTLAFSSSQASGTSSSSGLSQASTAPTGQTTSLFGSTSSSSGLSQASTAPIGQTTSLFGSTSSSSSLSQASTTPIGQTISLFGSTSSAFGSSQTHVNTESGHLQFAYPPTRQEPSLFGGSTPPAPSSGSPVLHSSTVESSSGFGSPLTFGNGNTQSTGISWFSTPVGRRPSQSGPNDSEFTFPSCILDPFRALGISGQRPSQSASQPAALAQSPASSHSLFGCAPSASLPSPWQTTAAPVFSFSEFRKPTGSDEFIKNDPYEEWFAERGERS